MYFILNLMLLLMPFNNLEYLGPNPLNKLGRVNWWYGFESHFLLGSLNEPIILNSKLKELCQNHFSETLYAAFRNSSQNSETRVGKILNNRQFIEGLISIYQNGEAKWANFLCCKWQIIEQIIELSGHADWKRKSFHRLPSRWMKQTFCASF